MGNGVFRALVETWKGVASAHTSFPWGGWEWAALGGLEWELAAEPSEVANGGLASPGRFGIV